MWKGHCRVYCIKKLANETLVPRGREEVRIVLDGKKVDDNATVGSLEVGDGDQLTECEWSVALGLVAGSLGIDNRR